jgi:signal peptidase II
MPLLFLLTILSFLAGYGARYAAETWLTNPIVLYEPYLFLQLATNPGVAFSMYLGPLQPLVVGLALLLFMWMGYKMSHITLAQFGFGFILGGAIMNIVDRLDDGLVTDYIRVMSFPIFNVPDALITIGVVLLLLEETIFKKREY